MADPRLQLYTAAEAKMAELAAEFRQTAEACHYDHQMIDEFTPIKDNAGLFAFADPSSTIEADQARLQYLTLHRPGEILLSLTLFRDGSPYVRERDMSFLNNQNCYEIAMFKEGPPTLLPDGKYMHLSENFATLKVLRKNGIGEIPGIQRSRSLLEAINALSFADYSIASQAPKILTES